jgi:hypothetical protein
MGWRNGSEQGGGINRIAMAESTGILIEEKKTSYKKTTGGLKSSRSIPSAAQLHEHRYQFRLK